MFNPEGPNARGTSINGTDVFNRKLTQHLPYSLVIEKLSKHFHRLADVRLFHAT